MKLNTTLAKLAALSTLALAAGAANAELYNFTITGDYTASWQMDSMPTPEVSAPGEGFIVIDVPGSFAGAVSPIVDLIFYSAAAGGGMGIEDYWEGLALLTADGPQLFSGTETNPVFNVGSYALTEYMGSGNYTLTISPVSAVPEPAALAMMLAGLGLVGAAARRKSAK